MRCSRRVPAGAAGRLDRYSGVLPDALLKIWAEFGWAGLADGRFWLRDPAEWAMAYEEWFGAVEPPLKDTHHVIARDAFGKFDCWGERTGPTLHLDVVTGTLSLDDDTARLQADGPDWSLNMWLLGHRPDRVEAYRNDGTGVFADARAGLGS